MKIPTGTRLLLAGFVALAAAAAGSGTVAAATLTVCANGCAFTQIAPAVAAANNGDTIAVAAGTYNGGFTIDKSVNLAGAGAGKTIISGGGPVITIGTFGASSEPTVSISGVTITGGVTRSSPESVPCTGKAGVWAAGGGIQVPPSSFTFGNDGVCRADDFGGGATVAISNSVITGNLVAPTDAVPYAPCGGCPAAWAFGGGIDTAGSLSLANTTVTDNLVGSATGFSEPSRFAEGGGVFGARGDMTITNSTVSGNQAGVSPDGVIADAAGIATTSTFTMSNSYVTNNRATVETDFVFGLVPSGGLHIKGDGQKGDAQTVSISNATISGNTARVTSSFGGAFANQGGLSIDICPPSPCALSNDVISDNSVIATALPGSFGNAGGRSGAGEFGGTLSNVQITGNSVEASSAAGNATALGGASVFDSGTITNGLISNNHVHASAPAGIVDVRGGALNVFGPTTLRNSTVSGNTVDASGASGSARGGGLYDGFNPDGPPGGPLVLQNSHVTANTLGGTGLLFQGGGVYLQDNPISLTNSAITQNAPDQCFGC